MIDPELLARAAALIREGRLVAFPTETVYGLGANALDPAAVSRIFSVKNRPTTSPLIVHVDSVGMARELVTDWPAAAGVLTRRYWPGPLTLVLPKRKCVPDIVTAGLPTVGIRVPNHPIALELIRAAGVPIAAPSANPFTRLSPTLATHVRKALGGRVDLILDGGPATVGIESTVLSLAGGPPRLLRPGMISQSEIEGLIGPVEAPGRDVDASSGGHASPGMHRQHYSPRTRLVVVEGDRLPAAGRGAYLWRSRPARAALCVSMPADPDSYAAMLYEVLHREDVQGRDRNAEEKPPGGPEWAGIMDRLARAAWGDTDQPKE